MQNLLLSPSCNTKLLILRREFLSSRFSYRGVNWRFRSILRFSGQKAKNNNFTLTDNDSYRLKFLLRHTWKNANNRNRQEKYLPEQEKTKQTENMHTWRTNKNLQAKQYCLVFPIPVSPLMVRPSHFRLSDARQPKGSEAFSLFYICLELTSPLPVDVLRSKTLLLKLPNTEPLSDLVAITSILYPFTGTRLSPPSPQKGTTLKCNTKKAVIRWNLWS